MGVHYGQVKDNEQNNELKLAIQISQIKGS